jgi:hypothetical protein
VDIGMQYRVECIGPDGQQKWVEDFHNLVVTVGRNFVLDTVFRGSAYNAS